MEVGEKFLEFLDANPQTSASVFEGNKTKAMVFDGVTIVTGKQIGRAHV